MEKQVFDLLEKTGLNWSVSKKPLVSIENDKTESFGIFRDGSKNWLGTVGKIYNPFQNHELALILLEATQSLNIEITKV